MPRLLSGSTLRRGGSGEFLDLKGAMPQLPPSETTETGFTLVTDSLYRTSYRSSLGFIDFKTATMYSSLPEGTIRILSTGNSYLALNTQSGTLVVQGGIGVGANMYIEQDIVVNELEIGRGFEGTNNIRFSGTATNLTNDFNIGQQSIIIGYDSLKGVSSAFRNIAVGTNALNSGSNLRNNIAIGDDSLKNIGATNYYVAATVTNVTIIPSSSIINVTNENPMKIVSLSHGLTSGKQIFVTDVTGITTSSITTGEYSLINTQTLYVSVIDPNTLATYYDSTLTVTVNATSATTYIGGGILRSPVEVTVTTPNLLETGKFVFLTELVGLDPLNDVDFYVKKLSANTIALFNDPILREATDGTGMPSYVSGGKFFIAPARSSNISYGHFSGEKLSDGENNIFIGNESGQFLTTGSNNIIIGNNKSFDLLSGSGIISIGGDNVINGRDNQVNIGSVLYFDGIDKINLYANTRIVSQTESTGTNNGALQVLGGLGVIKSTRIGGSLHVYGANTSTIANDILIEGNTTIKKSLTVDGNFDVNLIPESANIFLQPTLGGSITIQPSSIGNIDNMTIGLTTPREMVVTTAVVNSSATAVSTTTGALQVAGGVGIQGDIYSRTGNSLENYLLYSPRVFITPGTAPVGPRIGDVWIDSTVPAYLQYIKDGTSTFWIQVGAV